MDGQPTQHIELRHDPDSPVQLHPLVFHVDGDEVTIGRPDVDSYAIFPPDGAALVRRLGAGVTPIAAAEWYASEYGEDPDLDELLATLDELQFLRADGEAPAMVEPVRWQRLGRALFSRPAWLVYALLVAWAVLAMVRAPDLVPTYQHLFFTPYFTVMELTLFAVAVPLIALHEAFHALAGRRLGLRSKLHFGRRLYFLVVETSLDGLVAVPRRQRYLPILAGMLADVLMMAAFTIAADVTRSSDGAFSQTGRVCLAIAYATFLRLLWQTFLYLRTDLYVLVATLFHCVDLHGTAKQILANRFKRLLGRSGLADESAWHPVDRRIGRWYSWLIVIGYSTSLGTFFLALLPAGYRMYTETFGRYGDEQASGWELTDSTVFIAINVAQLAVVGWLAIRERRQRAAERYQHVLV
jgi:hypothetical protein